MKVLVPDKVKIPDPILVKAPVPDITPEICELDELEFIVKLLKLETLPCNEA